MCGCTKRPTTEFVWTSDPDTDGQTTEMVYPTLVQAKAKVIREGGSYISRPKQPVG